MCLVDLVGVAAGRRISYGAVGGRSKVTLAVLQGLVDVRSTNRLDQESVRRTRRKRRRRRVGVYDRPAAHKSTPDWFKQRKPLLLGFGSDCITGRPASGLQVR